MKKILILIIAALSVNGVFAQQVWYFGSQGGIQFPASGTALPISYTSTLPAGNPLNTSEGCAVAYDASGNVIISTDGSTVYNKLNKAMPSANGNLMGGSSSTQSAIIVPVPGCNCNKYFVFTVASLSKGNNATHPEDAGLRYSVVDMSRESGDGDIIPATINSALISTSLSNGSKFQGYISEKLTACKDGNGGYWVLAHGVAYNGSGDVNNASRSKLYDLNKKRFYAFHITSNSISGCENPKIDTSSNNCIITDIGLSLFKTVSGSDITTNAMGQMKFSSDGSKIAFTTWDDKTVELFDFNLNTGVVTNPKNFGPFSNSTYGVEFSPNINNLFVTTSRCNNSTTQGVYQLELSNTNPFTNKIVLEEKYELSCYKYAAMQLWTDGRIYIAKNGAVYLAVINSPNLSNTSTNFNSDAVKVKGGIRLGLPTFIQDFSSCADPCNKCHNVNFYLDKNYTMRKDTTFTIGCNKSIGFKSNNGCSNDNSTAVLGVTVKDNLNTTPSWASTFITNKGNGLLSLPNGLNTYIVTYYFGSVNAASNTKDTCDKITITINDTCKIQVPLACKCGQWGSIGYTIGNKTNKFRCGNNTQLEAGQGDFFKLRQRYVCFNNKGDSCGNGNIKYNIYYPNGGKLLNQTSLDKFKLDSCGVNRIVMIPTCGGVECQPCEFSIKVNCCKCASTFKAALFWTTGSGNSILDNQLDLKCGETYTNKLKCFQQYTINIENPCGYNCIPDSVIVTILQPNSVLIFGKSFTPNQVGTYSVTIKIKCNGKWCPPCIIKFVQTQKCELPCNNCLQNVQFDFDANSSTAIENIYPKPTSLNTYFTLFGGTDTYTQVRVNVVDFQITSDNPACLACYTSAGHWASIIDGDLPGFTSVISTYPGVAVANPNNNSREIIFNTNLPSLIPMPTTLNLGFQIPGANPLACCCIDVTLYLKVTYQNNKCEECTKIIKIAFKQCNGKKGEYVDGGQPHFRMHTPNNDDLKQINTNASSATKN